MKSRFLAFVMVVILSLSAFSVSFAGAADAEPVEIRAAWWGETVRHDLYGQILDEFMKAYPHIKVISEPTSWNDYWDKMAVQTAGSNAPDFMCMHPQYASDYIGRGVMEPLDPFVADGTISLDGWEQGVIDTGVVDGTNYMMAMGVTFSSIFVNKTTMDANGLAIPEAGWTWDDLKALGIEAREKFDANGKVDSYLFSDVSNAINQFRYFSRQQGHELYDTEGNVEFTAEDIEKWFTMFNEFRDLGIVPDAATSTEYYNATLEDSPIAREIVMMNFVPINQIALYNRTFPDRETIAIRHPGTAGGSVGEFPEGAHFGVSANTTPEKKLAAAQLLNFWLNSAESLKLFKLDQGVPGNANLQDAYVPLLDENQMIILNFVSDLMKVGTPTTFPPAGASEVDAMFKLVAEEVWFGMLTPADAAARIVQEANTIIEANK